MRSHSGRIQQKGYISLNNLGRVPFGPKGPLDLVVESGDYNPNYMIGTRRE